MIRAQGGKGPEAGNLNFFSREDLYNNRLLSHELLTVHFDALRRAVEKAGLEMLIVIALRRLIAPGLNLKDPEVAEAVNAQLTNLKQATGAAILSAHHDRKSPASTVEAQSFGSTMLTAEVDGVFDITRRKDGLREVSFEGRYRTESERFCLQLVKQAKGEQLRHAKWTEDGDPRRAEFRKLVASGKTVEAAADLLGISRATAFRWAKEG
jgi:hypothetical protein